MTELANELKRLVDQWVDSRFNYIPLRVAEKMVTDGDYEHLMDHIRQPDITADDLSDYNLLDAYRADEDADDYESYLEHHKPDALCEIRDANYPMWGTLFHLRDRPWDDFLAAAEGAGFIIIEDVPEFDGVMLGVRGAGYSFYSSHWIPLYLALYGPHNEELREKYKGVDYSMV